MNTVSFESSRNDVPPCLKDELCANTTSRIFPRSLDRAINRVIDIDVISITDTQYDPARRFHENRSNVSPCSVLLFSILAQKFLQVHDRTSMTLIRFAPR